MQSHDPFVLFVIGIEEDFFNIAPHGLDVVTIEDFVVIVRTDLLDINQLLQLRPIGLEVLPQLNADIGSPFFFIKRATI